MFTFIPFSAQASPKPWPLGWWPWHFEELDFERRLLDHPTYPNNQQWEKDKWQPQDWIAARGSAKAVLDAMYDAKIITDQDVEDGVPVLEVGPGFRRLSGREKRHVAAFVDYAYGITKKSGKDGLFHVIDDCTDEPIGLYTATTGLQLQ
ncbi:MAG: hypothetical protein L6Q57_00140 [Alphaproteobacteria bacterium]|nr:hypothetical protein [Alphaproteobacteria bacterium]